MSGALVRCGMRTGRPTKPLTLTEDERRTLEQWARRPTSAQRVAVRARVVLACADGQPNRAVARLLHVSGNSVGKWRERFRVRRLAGLADEPRPGVARKVTDDMVVDIITRTLEAPPPHTSQWTTRAMGESPGCRRRRSL